MRIIAGSRKGTPLKSLPGIGTRPTSDKVKESVFNIIGPYFDGGIAVELFGGSGSLSLEALSRGVDAAYIFEKSAKASAIIKENAEKCRFVDQVHIHRTDARNAVKLLQTRGGQADLLFMDPPYAKVELYNLAEDFAANNLLSDRAVIICEHEKQLEMPLAYGTYQKVKTSIYGNSAVSIYRK
ncbi:16S rRNA (guanine(966)-N(2))-methyltransferase RsmD [Filibacter tadaridae]|uniref:Ribosomal RNA small subunit methyltransferase D n=1 Tax=Filibacter tadaridae TaxID=2483811 RepID=A0A3P5X6H3_9BACL|nr:16S rRNA (guanine(966)-N(2))-methyltransferase RsmD [Filibacter tadaridae]VDC29863.1 Ribosomal RNA small subunit methyltransferase D [Filibacter tadaridae]